MDAMIRTAGLTKRFGRSTAVDEVSLSVGPGEIYGFLGLNGAGKTTTIRMLLGMIKPSAGASYLFGEKVNAARRDLWSKVGCLVEMPSLYPELTVYENLEVVRRLRRLNGTHWIEEAMEKLRLTPYRNRKARHLSLGNGQRLGLAKAMLHKPAVLVLDEPTNGLDPAGIVEVRQLLSELAAREGVTIFISSHLLGEVAKLATRIGIVHQGRLVQESDARELHGHLRKRLLVQVQSQNTEAAQAVLHSRGYAPLLAAADEGGTLATEHADAVANPERIARLLVEADVPPKLLRVEEEDLEAYFLRTIGMDGGMAQ
ncbi:ABC transporter ATP-binding protein [Cohnella lubricantis]|uniref:ABC transporter ATP-binding protein n=1 Tax=Cohnella lubricantis TaxID=2163172 RepID=A0A841T9I8_9BACL|nr:ABC transporter ATP-binding protein [Cohnella lubricantis]MBB6676088.1 ABC transporter ATP-binding protein [Cohnella lubricantis]MBP2118045.1 ABC-2 type transport system ATP-binding protein [Cohnella lubricantis]